jgi:hypothetical protein
MVRTITFIEPSFGLPTAYTDVIVPAFSVTSSGPRIGLPVTPAGSSETTWWPAARSPWANSPLAMLVKHGLAVDDDVRGRRGRGVREQDPRLAGCDRILVRRVDAHHRRAAHLGPDGARPRR